MTLGGERASVQNPFIDYAESVQWEYILKDKATALRGGTTGILFKEIFIDQIIRLNDSFMTRELATELAKRIGRIPPTIEGNLTAWEYLKGIKTIFVPKENRERNVRFIDTDDIDTNTFQITDEFSFTNGSKTIREDVVFLVNGIPVFFVETKAAHKKEGIAEALDQIRRYHRECPEMLAVLQIYALTHIIRYYYSATWNTSKKTLFNWKDESGGNYETLVKTFCDRKCFITLLTDGILFTRQDEELKKVVLRQHQMRAVDKLLGRARDAGKKRGLIWHTQGSGKTYTMIVAAQKILNEPVFENPTVIMLVDRNELETQLFGNLTAAGIGNVEVAESKRELQALLASDHRGLIVSMIHKFEGMPEKINTRDTIFILVDEAHRTTTGTLGNYLMGALPNATYIGFTGTPIDKTAYGQGTFITFGRDDPPHGYLDRYRIAESISDGTTVPLNYTLAPNDLLVDRRTLEKEFLDLAETEGISDVAELNKVLEKAVNLRNMMKSPERVPKVAKFVADHFRHNVEPMGYKAFLVAVDREACALYKKELDKLLPVEYSEVIYSPNPRDEGNDRVDLRTYYHAEDEEKRIRKAFRNPDKDPRILIVTEKLLTGFDAPVLYCIYLDKPMRDHVLLQAIARVNRPYEDAEGRKKPSGFVLDIVGIFDNLKKALAFDSSDIEGIVNDIDVLKTRFTRLMSQEAQQYFGLAKGKKRDKAVEAVLEYFLNEEVRLTFYGFFHEISDIYEILSPDAFLRPYLDDVDTLARMYRMVRENFDPGISVDREFSRKVARLVQDHTVSSEIGAPGRIYEIDDKVLRYIEEQPASDIEKVFNLSKGITNLVRKHSEESPYLLSISEKADAVIQLYKDRQKTTQETLAELKTIIEEINAARLEQEKRNIPMEEFTIFWLLNKTNVTDTETKAHEMKGILNQYPHWRASEQQARDVKQELYTIILKSGISEIKEIKKIVDQIMNVLKRAVE
ncbi:MAG: HsdR family type I site-specific deoxyribonuclease [Methanoregula sp.]|jgi:type I restriction enzyme R subunit|uniref:type I restriction endonuclease subunit R n=1 Tax=Methanoregula sp. TaxID=2052170 RepID=UPI0025F73104|nr:HsdR family type I site-specific deoxyribonuclease [Methanoregula sp.]MCK9631132.1 HsdR family type I site-specific deoxyribonuclease [Methanoregula sp.]